MCLINKAFTSINRKDFLPDEYKRRANQDRPFPIGHEQTNSQPSTVRHMLNWLDAKAGDKVLDVGSGSGWTTALLSRVVGKDGEVYAVERIPELAKLGEDNFNKANTHDNAKFHVAGKTLGLPKHAPYNRIHVGASANNTPVTLLEQLKSPGKMVMPVQDRIYVVSKDEDGRVGKESHLGFKFVPLV